MLGAVVCSSWAVACQSLPFRSAVSLLPAVCPGPTQGRQVGEPASRGGAEWLSVPSGTGRGHVLPGVRTGGHREPSRLRWSPLLIKLPDRAGLPAPLSALLDGVIAAATSQRVIVRTGETAPVKHVSHSARPLIAAQETLAVVMSATHRRAGALYLPSPRKCSRDSDPHPVSWGLGRRAGM